VLNIFFYPQDPTNAAAPSDQDASTTGAISPHEAQLRDSVHELLARVRAGPLRSLTIDEHNHLVDRSIFDTPHVPPAAAAAVLAAADAAIAAGDAPLARAMGALAGMAIADSLGHNFEFLPVQDGPGPHGPRLEYPPPPGAPARGALHGVLNRFPLRPVQ
jgi:hypothetical protein